MFRVIDPQPNADDISFWTMMYSEYHKSWGLSDPNHDPVGMEFIPLPEDIDPAGVTVIKRNNLWFWSRQLLHEGGLNTNDVLKLELGNGMVDSWEIQGFYYGGIGQESVIEVKKLGAKPPQVAHTMEGGEIVPFNVRTYIPANLVHCAIETGLLTIFKQREVATK